MSTTVKHSAVEPDLADWQDRFLDLLCHDDDLVRAEFDEIISAGWDTPPPPQPPTPGSHPSDGSARPVFTGLVATPRGRDAPPPVMRRQRSPPNAEWR